MTAQEWYESAVTPPHNKNKYFGFSFLVIEFGMCIYVFVCVGRCLGVRTRDVRKESAAGREVQAELSRHVAAF